MVLSDKSSNSQDASNRERRLPLSSLFFFKDWLTTTTQEARKALIFLSGDSQESSVSLIRDLIKSSGIYALGSLASPFVSLALMPFLTRTLSHTDYGILAVLNTIIALLAGVTQLGLSHAFFRAYSCDYETRHDRLSVVSTVVVLISLVSLPTIIAIMLTAPWLAELLLNDSSLSNPIRLAALVVLLQNLTIPGFSWLRAENRAVRFSVLAAANLLVNLTAALILVGIFHMGLAGALLASGSGYGVVVLSTLPIVLWHAKLRLRFDIARNLLSFGLPLVVSLVVAWVLQLSDRYLLGRLGTLAQAGSYAVAYSLGGVLGILVLTPFSLAWPTAMFAIAKREDAAQVFRLVFRWYGIVLLFIAFAVSLVGKAILEMLFPPAYHSVAPVIPVIAVSIVLYGLYDVLSVGMGVCRKTWLEAIAMGLSALINVGANIILIPHYGSMGAAVSTLIAYAFLALISYAMNQYIYPIPFEIGKFAAVLVLGTLLYIGSSLAGQAQGIYGSYAISLGTLSLYGGCLVVLGRLPLGRPRSKTSLAIGELYIMKTAISHDVSQGNTRRAARQSFRVCMHVQGIARTDPRVMREATALVEAGFAVSIVDIEAESNRGPMEDIQGVCVKHVCMPSWYISTLFPWSLFKAMLMFVRTTFRVLYTSADVYHAHDVPALPACYVAARLHRKPLIFDAHELPLSEMPLSAMSVSRRSIHPLLTYLFRAMVPYCSGIIATSSPMAREISRLYHIPEVSVVRNFPMYRLIKKSDRLRQHLGLSPTVRIALYQGYIQPDRELDRVARAAAFLEENIVIVMMGKGDQVTLSQLEALISSEETADRVKILPPVPYAELLDWTASADIGLAIFSPDYTPHMKVCLPNKLFEYLMVGLPVLASPLEAVAEVINTYDVGYILPSLTPADIGVAINMMLTNEDRLAHMRYNAVDAAQREFCWDKERLQLVHLYHATLGLEHVEGNATKIASHSQVQIAREEKGSLL